jgi:glycosyltransferase involved in cell wall biosynthesis
MTNKISVLTTLFNHERFIEEALLSALTQTLPPSEIIVLDDASTDNSLEVARSVSHPTIQILAANCNLGGPNTMKGLNTCKEDLIAILNSDDAWAPEKLEKQFSNLASSPRTGVVFTHIIPIDESGTTWDTNSHRHQQIFNVSNRSRYQWLRHFFLFGNPFCASSALIRKECFNSLGPLDGSYIQLQDFDMWIRVAIAGYDLHVIEEPLTHYRIMRDSSNISSGHSGARATNSFEYAKTLRNYWRLASLQELVLVFPEINVSDKANDSLTLFYLAQYAAKQPGIHHRLFALETMSKWGGDLEARSLAYDCHGFDFFEYRNFLARGPIRNLLRLSIRHLINSVAMRILPYGGHALYQRLNSLFFGRRHQQHLKVKPNEQTPQ